MHCFELMPYLFVFIHIYFHYISWYIDTISFIFSFACQTVFNFMTCCFAFPFHGRTVYLKKYAHGLVLCFVVVMQSFIMNSHEVSIHIHQGCFAGTGAIVRLPQCQWSKPDGYGIISRCITTTKHSKAKTACIFLGIYCSFDSFYGIIILYLCLTLL